MTLHSTRRCLQDVIVTVDEGETEEEEEEKEKEEEEEQDIITVDKEETEEEEEEDIINVDEEETEEDEEGEELLSTSPLPSSSSVSRATYSAAPASPYEGRASLELARDVNLRDVDHQDGCRVESKDGHKVEGATATAVDTIVDTLEDNLKGLRLESGPRVCTQ
jgi:hypothetical protein